MASNLFVPGILIGLGIGLAIGCVAALVQNESWYKTAIQISDDWAALCEEILGELKKVKKMKDELYWELLMEQHEHDVVMTESRKDAEESDEESSDD